MVKLFGSVLAAASGFFLLSNALPQAKNARQAAWPDGPFVTSGRWILNASGKNVTYAGVNWSGHGEAMVPEGLQFQSVETIVGKIKGLGMNVVRLTYATQMVDEIFASGKEGSDVSIQTAFVAALGQDNGTAVLQRVLRNNPAFSATTTRLQVSERARRLHAMTRVAGRPTAF